MVDLKHFYEEMADNYSPSDMAIAKGKRRIIAHDDRFEIMVKYLNKTFKEMKGLNILDIACGDGVYERNVSKDILLNNNFYGVDISEKQLKKAKEFFKYTALVNIDVESLPYDKKFFDFVICSEVIEHVFYPEKLLNEVMRVLKKGGIIILTTPNLSCIQNRLALLFFGDSPNFNYSINKQHIRFFNKKTLIEMLSGHATLLKQIGINSMLFEKYLFPRRIIFPYFIQKIFNRLFPNLGGGLFLVFKKN